MARKPLILIAALALAQTGCGHWHHVVVESRVLVLAPVPVSVTSKVDLTKKALQ